MIFKFERTQRVGNTLQGIGNAVGIVVGWVNAPLITGLMMTDMPDTVENRITHIDVGDAISILARKE